MPLPHFFDSATHIIWDWNGTLLDDTQLVLEITNEMLESHGLSRLDIERYRAIFGFPIEGYYRQLGFTDAHGDFVALAMRFISEYAQRVRSSPLHSGAVAALAAVSARGLTQSMLTAAEQESVETLLVHHGIRSHLGDVVGLDNHYGSGKIECGTHWITTHDIDPADMMLVGDTVHDYEVAEALGVQCVLIAQGHNSRERLDACGCTVLSSLDAFVADG